MKREIRMMKCGCVAQGTVNLGPNRSMVPGCLIHSCIEEMPVPDLTGRTAKCAYGGNEVPSNPELPFFEYKPEEKHDKYYCGCFGWD